MPDNLLLYSANTWIAYLIAEKYYGNIHYVWCTPHFDNNSLSTLSITVPPSSLPQSIYHEIKSAITGRDRHCAKIKDNKVGILKGAEFKERTGVITHDQFLEISAIVDEAELADFRPLIYVIPFNKVTALLSEVPVAERAHPLSVEYRIENLPRDCFDVIELSRG